MICSLQYSVSVSYSVAVSNAELAIMDKEQGIATKTIRLVGGCGQGVWQVM